MLECVCLCVCVRENNCAKLIKFHLDTFGRSSRACVRASSRARRFCVFACVCMYLDYFRCDIFVRRRSGDDDDNSSVVAWGVRRRVVCGEAPLVSANTHTHTHTNMYNHSATSHYGSITRSAMFVHSLTHTFARPFDGSQQPQTTPPPPVITYIYIYSVYTRIATYIA